ncbi:MAG: ABC transporter ATP-binding protein [Gammaproteobacteria bacterium]|nr:MAG: ABC transporter ATP-binding protein [Gammaproteobacteria bacterium]
MLLGTIAELASLGMVFPFLGALTAPDNIFKHELAQPLIFKLNLTSSDQLLLPLTFLFGIAAIFSGFTRLALLWGQARIGNAIGNDLGSEAYRLTLYQPYKFHASRNSSEIIAILMTKINTVVYYIIIPLLMLITSIFTVFTIVAFMILVAPKLTLATCLGFACIYFFIAYSTKKRLKKDSEHVTTGQNNVAKIVQEGLGGIRDILIDGLQETYHNIYRQADNKFRRALANIAIISGAPRPAIEAFGLVLIGFIAYMFTNPKNGMTTAIPLLGALALAAQRLLPLVQQGYAGWTSMQGGRDSLKDVLELLEQPHPHYIKQPISTPIPFKDNISINNLEFQYSLDNPIVLHDINLKIPCGSKIGFIGTTGSGKSTLLDIIMGLLTPTSGSLCIDGIQIDEKNQRAWQAHIAHVPQTIYLADATVAENIAFGEKLENINQEKLANAANMAQVSDVIESWDDGYNTFVGERGIRLSGGQRQRIGIARAIYKQANVIVFDEATSALDNKTEKSVMESINSLGRDITIIMVAHRITTLQSCDTIVELNHGKIQRIGSYEDIFNTPPKKT